jgi:nucleotide-binding universal stress UspA family protein
MGQKILVAVDESENAMRAVKFISESFTPDHKITLFSVIQDTPAICAMNSPSLTPYFVSQQAAFCELEDRKKTLVMNALKEARELLLQAGFQEENIKTKVEDKQKGVARAIIDEAGTGYDTIVMGRRGLSRIQEFFLGSVSHKVLLSTHGVYVVLVE